VLLLGALTGCSGTTQPTAQAPSATKSTAPSKPQEQIDSEYLAASTASCEKAQEVGVVEEGPGFTVVSVPKSQAYEGYSAAYLEDPDNYELIWEMDALVVCADAMSIQMAEEAGEPWPLKVSFNTETGTYEVFEDFGQYGTSNLAYLVEGGLIVEVNDLGDSDAGDRKINYGNLTEAHWKILRTAADEFLASN
jgi:hypothetical protein